MHPTNNSVSVTLCQRQLNTTTRIISDSSMTACSLKLNGKFQHEIPGRILDVIIIAQLRARLLNRSVHPYVRIESTNGFPTAAGLASSASGLASLAFGLAQMYGLREDIAGIARRGSGSACRSTYGGFVHWSVSMGAAGTPISSVVSLYPASYWPTLKVLVCLVSAGIDI
ncbi:unnamed protein product [Dicrocoelium dendriticum]|nr:unnamed protein product [Dicrocoelium dendriticum]